MFSITLHPFPYKYTNPAPPEQAKNIMVGRKAYLLVLLVVFGKSQKLPFGSILVLFHSVPHAVIPSYPI